MSEYPYDFVDEDNKIICQLCGKSFLIISPRHLQKHNITHSEYRLRFPDAPLSSEQFNVMGKYGKEKQLFVKEELSNFDNDPEIEDFDMDDPDVPNHDVNPTIEEEINFGQTAEEIPTSSLDICNINKDKVLDHLRSFFTNIKKDYMIQIFSVDNRLMFEFVSDFADPVLKINVEFPNTFWHNRMQYDDHNRDRKLTEYGWKVIRIDSKSPSYRNISKALERL
jgi:very-short-patch-repair endonuclease